MFLNAPVDAVYQLVTAVPLPAPLVIVLLTVAVRALLLPLAVRVARASNPLHGIVPSLLQVPFFMVLYRLFSTPTVHGGQNLLLSSRFLDVPLKTHFLAEPTAAAFWLLFVVLALLATWAVRRMPAQTPGPMRALAFTTVIVVAFVPLAAGLYLATSAAWTAGERILLRGEPPVSPAT